MPKKPRNLGDAPGRSGTEIAVEVLKMAVSPVPVFGGSVTAFIDLLVGPSLQKRHDEWIKQIADAVQEIAERLDDFDPHKLQENQVLITAVLTTSALAIKTHQSEKLDSFRRAIVNSVLPGAPEEFEQMTFLRFVDELTPLHVRMLRLLDDPGGWFDGHGIPRPDLMSAGLWAIFEPGLPALAGKREMSDLALMDLMSRSLTLHMTVGGMMSGSALWARRSSDFGRQFLAFIT